MKKKLLCALLTLTMCTSLLPTAAFAETTVSTTPTVKGGYIYANGVPIFIEAGKEDSTLTSVYYMDGEEKVYLDLNPNMEGVQTENSLSSWNIYGGAEEGSVASTSITMTGGSVTRIYSGGGYQQTVTGDTSVVMEGGMVANIYNGSNQGVVEGTTTIEISGGTISGVDQSGTVKNFVIRMTGGEVLGSVSGEDGLLGKVTDIIEITVTGGKVGSKVRAKATDSVATAYGYIDYHPGMTGTSFEVMDGSFDHLLYKTQYSEYKKAFGDLFVSYTVPDGKRLIIENGKTLTIPENKILTVNGSLEIDGTLIVKGTVVNNGEIYKDDNSKIINKDGVEHICYTGEDECRKYNGFEHRRYCKDCPIGNSKFEYHGLLDNGKCSCGEDIVAACIDEDGEIFAGYTTAETALSSDGAVKLLRDVQVESSDYQNVQVNLYSLDLNGYTLDVGSRRLYIDYGVMPEYGTTFTIKDSSENRTGKITGENGGNATAFVYDGDIALDDTYTGTLCVDAHSPGLFAKGMAAKAAQFVPADDKYVVTANGDDLYLKGDFSKAAVYAQNLSYTGERQEGKPLAVRFGEVRLSSGDYTVTWPEDMTNAGEKTVLLSPTDTTNYFGTATGAFEILPKVLAVAGATAQSRPYDGTKAVVITEVVLSGILVSDEVQADRTGLKGTVESADAGEYTSVTLPELKLTGAAAGNYTVSAGAVTSTDVEITKVKDKRSGEWTNPIVNGLAKEYQIDLSKCEPTVGEWGKDKTYSYAITYSPNAEMSAYKDRISAEIDENGMLTISVPTVDTYVEGTAAVVTVTINSQNYENWTKGILLTASNREAVTLDVFVPEKSYDGKAIAEEDIEVTAKLNDTEVTNVSGYTYQWLDAEGNTLEQVPVNVGSYQLVVSVLADDEKYMGTITVPVTIIKGEPDVAMLYTPITESGKTLKDAELELDGNSTPGTLAWVLPETTAVAANTEYEWKFTPSDSANYKEMTGTIVLWEKAVSSSGGSGGGSNSTTVTNKGNSIEVETSSGTISESNADKVIDRAVENDSDEIVIDTNKDKVTLPASMAERITDETDADLVVETKNGIVIIPNSTLEDLDAEGKVTVEVTKDKVTISDEDGELSDIGKIEVTVPYKENSKTGNVAVEVTKADGTKEVIENVYDGKDSVTFTVGGSVIFEIIDDYVPMADVPVVPEQPAENPFKDVSEKDWFYKAVMYVSENGLMSGVDAENFGPSWNTTRGMITTILWRMEGKPVAGAVPFTDVNADMYYADAIAWAAENGIVSGYGDTFGPDDNITREQMASILYRYAQFKGDGFDGLWAFRLDFSDVAGLSDYAYEPMCWCVMNGIISGNGDGTLNPDGYAQRAHAAQMLMKFLENVK